jgi:hypothetical protein
MLLVMYRRSRKLYKKKRYHRSKEEPCRDSGLNSEEEEVQPHAVLQEEKGSEERTQTEGIDIQPIDNLQTASQIRVVCQSHAGWKYFIGLFGGQCVGSGET